MDPQIGADAPQAEENSATAPPLRRSSRRVQSRPEISSSASKPSSTMAEQRRNPKRKASETSKYVADLPDNLLEEALKPLTAKEIEDWEGWVELESEPAFFNIILRDLGVKDVKAQEIFTIDQCSMDILPKPVFGLIFLFQYVPGPDEEDQDVDISDVWFANQTTNNACATVALLNIVMNAPHINLGDKLQSFKASTQNLSTALRGYQLSNNSFIRTIHNSFTRRMDHLNADLCLENAVSDSKTKKARKRARQPKKTMAKNNVSSEYGFHFIAYVPAGGYVWELDGLRYKPHRLDAVPPEGNWTEVARPQIEARMLQYEESQLSFNLLALCQSPIAAYSRAIAQSLASLQCLYSAMERNAVFKELVSAEENDLLKPDPSRLSEFNITESVIESTDIPQAFKERISDPNLSASDAYELYQNLVTDTKATMGEYRAELMAVADDEQRVKGRKKDYGPALHKWVAKLAERGVLEEMIKSSH